MQMAQGGCVSKPMYKGILICKETKATKNNILREEKGMIEPFKRENTDIAFVTVI